MAEGWKNKLFEAVFNQPMEETTRWEPIEPVRQPSQPQDEGIPYMHAEDDAEFTDTVADLLKPFGYVLAARPETVDDATNFLRLYVQGVLGIRCVIVDGKLPINNRDWDGSGGMIYDFMTKNGIGLPILGITGGNPDILKRALGGAAVFGKGRFSASVPAIVAYLKQNVR